MLDFSVFDSILDCIFVLDAEGKVLYCNDVAATFCQTSVRRIAGKAFLSDLIQVEEPGILPFGESSIGRTSPSAFVETQVTVMKAEKAGKAQLALRPIDASHWLFFLRDVSLEEALHSKYRSELSQKEAYAKNLEKLVEARTAELRAVNQTLKAILNSLGQGFFTFNADGDCGPVFTRACEDILETSPKDGKVWDVLSVANADRDQFTKWMDTLFKEPLPFDDMKSLGPGLFTHSQGKHVTLEYYPIRRDNESVSDVVVVATDKTIEHEAQKALENERQFAAMVVKFVKNKEQFLQFLMSVNKTIEKLEALAQESFSPEKVAESFRLLHTLEGEAGTFSLKSLRDLARESQHILEPCKGEEKVFDSAILATYGQSLKTMASAFADFLTESRDLFGLRAEEHVPTIEVSSEALNSFLIKLQEAGGNERLVRTYQELFYKVPVGQKLCYFENLIQTVAERLEKRVKPLVIVGGETRVFPEPYQNLFASLVHAFRNAIDHGLESPEEREWDGKDPAGTIQIDVELANGSLRLNISDDGKGIDPELIREKLKGKFPTKDFSKKSDEEIIQQICMPGFSSRDSVGEFSGRGIGLDAVREEVLKLGGTLHIKSKLGKGTAIEITVPELGNDVVVALRSA